MIADVQKWQRLVLLITAPLMFLWGAIIFSRAGGNYSYLLLPVFMTGGTVLVFLIYQAARLNRAALLFLLVAAAIGLCYRVRASDAPISTSDDGRDWQNMIKLLIWGCLFVPCLVNWRRILPYCQKIDLIFPLLFCTLSVISVLWSAVPVLTAASALGLVLYLAFG
jgi:hypothetical protein